MANEDRSRQPFSKRHGHTASDPEITIWEDAPGGVRFTVIEAARRLGRLSPSTLRRIVCRVLRVPPDLNNWTEFPNVENEVQELVNGCAWYRVYDIAEAIAEHIYDGDSEYYEAFSSEVNECLRETGVGWQLKDRLVQARGSDAHERLLVAASEAMKASGLTTARGELEEATRDLSRRPTPDLSGAVQHAMAALECTARDIAKDTKATLGELMKRPNLLPKPLDEVVSKAWGYASDQARHGREDRKLDRPEVQLVVGLSAVMATYLLQKVGSD